MADLLTRGLPGRHTRFKMTEIGEVPEGWQVVRLGDVAGGRPRSTPRPARDPRFFGGDAVPWITVGELSKDDWPYLNRTAAASLTREAAQSLPNARHAGALQQWLWVRSSQDSPAGRVRE